MKSLMRHNTQIFSYFYVTVFWGSFPKQMEKLIKCSFEHIFTYFENKINTHFLFYSPWSFFSCFSAYAWLHKVFELEKNLLCTNQYYELVCAYDDKRIFVEDKIWYSEEWSPLFFVKRKETSISWLVITVGNIGIKLW